MLTNVKCSKAVQFLLTFVKGTETDEQEFLQEHITPCHSITGYACNRTVRMGCEDVQRPGAGFLPQGGIGHLQEHIQGSQNGCCPRNPQCGKNKDKFR